ncbi:hypothetical protein DU500_00680 [Haloplanus rubicundus]|uniref:DUF8135 domain-containing protein n=1 Tax=Haloplanus rubicundus TaxID=1547898 RepID=A0A345DYN5_9EURY|nr:hypothetical protein [Haloplanus rubicundus]AXG05057.1 hypothetical protein DU500_00680 [Haloplanus rubicundus]
MTDESADEPTAPFESDASEATADDEAASDDAPLGELAREVRARREARESDDGADLPDDDLFEPVEVDHVDDEAVWESFAEGETGPEEGVGLGSRAEAAPESDEHVVPKRDFCQRCPHFSDPPEATCSHEGTTIVEVVDADSFRVRNCPVVEDKDDASRYG